MALVAIHAVVDVSPDALVILIGLRLGVTVGALENGVIIGICVTRRAYAVRVAVVDWKLRVLCVVERRVLPVGRVVTVLTSRREKLRLGRVSRIRRLVVIGLMAANARGRQRLIVVVDVAVGTRPWRDRMRSG